MKFVVELPFCRLDVFLVNLVKQYDRSGSQGIAEFFDADVAIVIFVVVSNQSKKILFAEFFVHKSKVFRPLTEQRLELIV